MRTLLKNKNMDRLKKKYVKLLLIKMKDLSLSFLLNPCDKS
ncbi:hypothetical protein TCARB_0114 [Thermofilum adornatum 1505]|uniref:Uncharacterized protein n=1 Tax=Thermofilum adornatum 1505 TaxID=697581 RepID=A0A3G1A4A2_9CREN|nr:hypothetical protein TCARB_0114 [Thermofilum adornatum 1505]